MSPNCAYCSDSASGIDADGEWTCGAETCTQTVQPMPRVIESTDDEDIERAER